MSDPVARPTGLPSLTDAQIRAALAEAGRRPDCREAVLEALREAERTAADPEQFREQVRWPLIAGLLAEARHQVRLENGLRFEVGTESRIEKALLLSREARPDHVWEPQTTRLLVEMARSAAAMIVGGAYIGDQVLPAAHAIPEGGIVLAYEPMPHAFGCLRRNLEINGILNVRARRMALWDRSGTELALEGPAALASSREMGVEPEGERVPAITIDSVVKEEGLGRVDVVMLDLEGGEERALHGAQTLLSRPAPEAPHVIFEVHRSYVDWSSGLARTEPVQYLIGLGYEVFAIRDFHDNVRMSSRAIEVVPVGSVYLEGPPHGFNLLATKDTELLARLAVRVVPGVSPKLLAHRDPRLHHPIDGLPE